MRRNDLSDVQADTKLVISNKPYLGTNDDSTGFVSIIKPEVSFGSLTIQSDMVGSLLDDVYSELPEVPNSPDAASDTKSTPRVHFAPEAVDGEATFQAAEERIFTADVYANHCERKFGDRCGEIRGLEVSARDWFMYQFISGHLEQLRKKRNESFKDTRRLYRERQDPFEGNSVYRMESLDGVVSSFTFGTGLRRNPLLFQQSDVFNVSLWMPGRYPRLYKGSVTVSQVDTTTGEITWLISQDTAAKRRTCKCYCEWKPVYFEFFRTVVKQNWDVLELQFRIQVLKSAQSDAEVTITVIREAGKVISTQVNADGHKTC